MDNPAQPKEPTLDRGSPPGPGPGGDPVGIVGIVGINLYLVVTVIICLWALVILWPGAPALTQTQGPVEQTGVVDSTTPQQSNVPAAQASNATPVTRPSEIYVLGWKLTLWDEVRLLLIVMLGGALGSLVHALRSVYWYVGNRELRRSWLPKYFLLPFGGSSLAVIFYVVIRGGFFSAQANVQQTSPFGFVALAALVGLFSEQAVLKLKEVAETVLSTPAPGADNKPQGGPAGH